MREANVFPTYRGEMEYVCLGCQARYPIDELHYTCPSCKGVFLLEDTGFSELEKTPGQAWRDIFDLRAATKNPALRGIFRFYELMAPVVAEEHIVYLGEGNTPVTRSSPALERLVGQSMAFKNDGQNPSASFKDRGMACAYSYLRHLVAKHDWDNVLTICASTGDTSAAAALYAAYVGEPLTSVVLLPQGKVTAQQLSQPLGSGAKVLEIPGVFDDCMKVVEYLADHYRVALLNSKNAWRILGQESYAFAAAALEALARWWSNVPSRPRTSVSIFPLSASRPCNPWPRSARHAWPSRPEGAFFFEQDKALAFADSHGLTLIGLPGSS